MPVLTSIMPIVDSAHALGVVLNSRLTMAAHVGSVCRSAYYQLRQLRPVMRSLSLDASPGIHLTRPGLLQLNVIRHHRQLVSALTSRSKCHRMPYHWRAVQGPHHSNPAAASLAPGPRTSYLQTRLVGFQGVARSVAAVSRMTVSCSTIPRAVNSDRLRLRLVLSCGLTRLSAIVVLLWLDREHGTVAYQIATTRPQP